jgi:hypothetical protein
MIHNSIQQTEYVQSSSSLRQELLSFSIGKYAVILITVVGLGLVFTALGNYLLNPLIYNRTQQRTAARILAEGGNIAIPDSNIDWRDLRREHLYLMSTAPDIVIFGGSRWQEASRAVAPGYKLYNSFVSSDHFEDMMGLTELLYTSQRLPKILILSVRFSTFEFLDRRDAAWWKSFGSEYRAMAHRLGIAAHPWLNTLSIDKWLNLLSLDALITKLTQYSRLGVRWQATDMVPDPVLDTVGSDGALRFSDRQLQVATVDYAQKDATTMAAKHRAKRLMIDHTLVAQLEPLLAFLNKHGVQVVFAQTPFHPAYLQGIKGSPYYADLQQVEAELNRVAATTGVRVVGNFDAAQVGCVEADYRDFNHARGECLRKIIMQIPGLF